MDCAKWIASPDDALSGHHPLKECPLLSIFELSALLLTLSAVLGWVNHKFLPMSRTSGC